MALTCFAVVFPAELPDKTALAGLMLGLGEFGDLTQIVIVNLAARFHDPVSVGTGSLAALWTVAALVIVGGRALVRVVPARLVTLIGAAVMAVLAVVSLVNAITG